MVINRISTDDLILLIDSVSDYAIIMLDVNGNIISWNKGAQNIKGYTAEEAIGQNYAIFYLPEEVEKNIPQKNLQKAAKNGSYTVSAPRVKKDGTTFWGYMVITALFTEEGQLRGFAKITQDITTQKELRDEIDNLHIEFERKIREKLKVAIKENVDYKRALDKSAIVTVTDHLGKITHVNDNFCRISKYSRQELIGQNHRIVNSGYHDKAFFDHLWTTISRGETWTGEFRNRAKDGTFYWVDATIVPFNDDQGKPYQYIAIRSDITSRKESEEKMKAVNADLSQQKKELELSNEQLEQFAYVASHDLQEPLRMVTSFLTQLESKYGNVLDDKGKRYINFAVDGAKRMRTIILDLLYFYQIGKQDEDIEQVDLNELLNSVILLFQKENRAQISYSNLPVIRSHKSQLRQVFQNLIGNALKYKKADVPLKLEISGTETDTYYQFAVKDNGIGIPAEYFEKVFLIFQRLHTSAEYSGNGIGLSITKKIIENLGGKIWLESEVGEGTTFYFTLSKIRS